MSQASPDQMNRDQLVDRVETLESELNRLEAILYKIVDRSKANEKELEEFHNSYDESRLQKIEEKADHALFIASKGSETGEKNKTEYAKSISRNTLVVRALRGGPAKDRKITIADVQQKGEDEGRELAWEIVNRSWKQLREEWSQFYETSKQGKKALNVREKDITKPLVIEVQTDLGEDDLTKRFVGDESVGGV